MAEAPLHDKASILVVDDDPVVRWLMHETLTEDGYSVIEAADGMEGYLLYHEHRPDLLLLDLVMPRMDGYELCRILRAGAESAHAPIVVTTGLNDVRSIARAYDVGATDFIAKPVNWLVLRHRIRHILRASHAVEEARREAERLISTQEAAQAASLTRTEFLANVSHELRTRLNAIVGFSGMMSDRMLGPLDEKYAEYANIIRESGRHLLAIINGTLEMAEADEDRPALTEERVEIKDAVEFGSKIVEDMARRAQIDFISEIEERLPPLIADPAKLTQILVNLLSNAVKFTAPGGKVRLSVATAEDRGVLFRVEDTGIGMSPDQIPIALAPFGQISNSMTRKHDGVGLGLPLTKRLVELHGGTIELDSEPGRGTIASVHLPRWRVCGDRHATAAEVNAPLQSSA